MYSDLIYSAPGLMEGQLSSFYKDASFGVPENDIARVYTPAGAPNVTVVRDRSFGVAHIFGTTRHDTMYAEGYTTAEDPLSTNTDGDACGDAREIASINGDTTVNSIDLQQVAGAFGPSTNPAYIADFDTNKDGSINAIDLQFVAARFGPCP